MLPSVSTNPMTDRMLALTSIPIAGQNVNCAVFASPRPSVIVLSHERSGTHFLMNTLARSYGYVSWLWIDLDPMVIPMDDGDPRAIERLLGRFAAKRVASIVKSHHAVEFFDGVLDRIAERYVMFYIHRDPVDVMLSFFRFIHGMPWYRGPQKDDPATFALAEPTGAMMRYELRHHQSLLHRWQDHVEGWVAAAATRPRIVVVRYEGLQDRFEMTVRGFRAALGAEPVDLSPPPRDVNTIHIPVRGRIGEISRLDPAIADLRKVAREAVGDTMERLGYF